MLIRSLIVFLVVLNLGVSAWWIFHAPPPAAPEPALPLGVARLQLAAEAATAPAAPGPVDASPADDSRVAQCAGFGPFTEDELVAARNVLEPRVLRLVPRRQEEGATRGWRVYLPPFDSVEAVEAAAGRVSEAGFSDYFIVRDGIEANSLALGRYGSEAAAQRRVSELAEKGIAARAMPIGSGAARVWLDVEANAAFDVELAQADARAPGHVMLDCPPTP
ncbi:SPOR domain-containing protein [Marilutibacter aestuarii]|uniref:SPOR domain-containing protein n=1 Tax=Marilutibacter aestuarii TaxID=1706195 RepID=A0A507ZR87_9GAMM|nr:SPOR domain-containing protein [Lysobacter aestuarii]TQD39497.1 SPOR domain-containing protein [Lysobacter aestuarii]